MPAPSLADATAIVTNNGLRTQYGLILPPGARVAAYVRSTGVQSGDDAFLAQNLVATVAQGMARARSGLGDFVVCLPGHTESVADATTFSGALVPGVKIVGVGRGSNMPTFRFTAVASQWLVNQVDVAIVGLRFFMDSANTTLPFSITANDFGFYFNEILSLSGTANAVTYMGVSSLAARFDISNNIVRTLVIAGSTSTCIAITTTGADGRIADNEIMGSFSFGSNNGIINVTAATTNLKILRNVLNNTATTSATAIGFTNVAATGHCAYNTMTVLSTGAISAGVTGITVGGTNNLTGFFQNFCVNDPNKSGVLVPAVDT
jgi:hypothetical protein